MSVVVGTVLAMVNLPRSNCSTGLPVDVFWHACPDLGSLDGHIDALVRALVNVLKEPACRRWNPYAETMAQREFRHRLVAASRGDLIPVDHVKSVQHPMAAEMFEIRWQHVNVTEVVDGKTRHRQAQVRLLHAEPARLGLVALGLHAHEKRVVRGDARATRAAQDREIETAIGVYARALPEWLKRSSTWLDRDTPEV